MCVLCARKAHMQVRESHVARHVSDAEQAAIHTYRSAGRQAGERAYVSIWSPYTRWTAAYQCRYRCPRGGLRGGRPAAPAPHLPGPRPPSPTSWAWRCSPRADRQAGGGRSPRPRRTSAPGPCVPAVDGAGGRRERVRGKARWQVSLESAASLSSSTFENSVFFLTLNSTDSFVDDHFTLMLITSSSAPIVPFLVFLSRRTCSLSSRGCATPRG